MQDPVTVVGNGFIPGLPGIYGNTVIPVPTEEISEPTLDTSVSPPPSADSAEQSPDSIPSSRQAKAKSAATTN